MSAEQPAKEQESKPKPVVYPFPYEIRWARNKSRNEYLEKLKTDSDKEKAEELALYYKLKDVIISQLEHFKDVRVSHAVIRYVMYPIGEYLHSDTMYLRSNYGIVAVWNKTRSTYRMSWTDDDHIEEGHDLVSTVVMDPKTMLIRSATIGPAYLDVE